MSGVGRGGGGAFKRYLACEQCALGAGDERKAVRPGHILE